MLRGAGEQAFAAGADVSEFPTVRANAAQARVYAEVTSRAMRAVADCPHPVIAMIHGVCVGGGLEIAALCDLRICGTSSRFGAPVGKLGLVMSYDEMAGLVALAGRSTTLEILLEGRILDANDAYVKNLVTRVVPDAEVESPKPSPPPSASPMERPSSPAGIARPHASLRPALHPPSSRLTRVTSATTPKIFRSV